MNDFLNIFFDEEEGKESPGSAERGNSNSFADIFFNAEGPGASPFNPLAVPSAVEFNEDYMFWGLRNLPISDAPKHLLACGTVGSGKTKLINLFLQSIAPRFRAGRSKPEQLIIFDAKCDIVPTLDVLGYKPDDPNVWLMNPFDTRCAIWNIAEAVQEPAMARYLAALLVPEEKESTAPFFSNAAREIVYAVILALNTRKGKAWTFRDLMCALDSADHVRRVTAHDSHAERHALQFIRDVKHYPGVLTSITTRVGPFTQVAALWHTHPKSKAIPKKFCIKEFLEKPGVLVLGYDPVLNDSLWPLNAMLLKALTNEILRRPETRAPRHWFILDEFRAMQKVEFIVDLLNRGRSKGAAVLLGVQSVEGMVNVYQSAGANEILGLCANKTFLRAGGPDTAKWAEEFFNKVRTTEHVVTETWSSTGYSYSVAHQVHDRPLFLASMFLDLPYPEKGCFVCINDIPHLNAATISRRPFEQLLKWEIKMPGDKRAEPALCPRVNHLDQKIEPWSEEEEREFCKEGLPEDSAAAKAAPEKKKKRKPPTWRDEQRKMANQQSPRPRRGKRSPRSKNRGDSSAYD